jgi:type II secretory pathway component PulF
LSRALAGWERLPRSFAPLLAGGERTGDLVGVLEEASRIYEAHAQGLLDREGRTFQLAFTLICGLLVGSTALLLFGAYYGLAASLAGAAG